VHFKNIRDRVLQDRRRREVLRTYCRVLRGERVPDNPQSLAQNTLTLARLVRRTPEGALSLSNRVYERVFGPEWFGGAAADLESGHSGRGRPPAFSDGAARRNSAV